MMMVMVRRTERRNSERGVHYCRRIKRMVMVHDGRRGNVMVMNGVVHGHRMRWNRVGVAVMHFVDKRINV